MDQTRQRIAAQKRYLRNLETERARAAGQLQQARRRLHEAERAVARIPDVEAAIARRREWLLTHPAELAWEADLATRLVKHVDEPVPIAGHCQDGLQPELETSRRSIDLRTIKLEDRKPRTRFERAVRDALGIARPRSHPQRPPPATARTRHRRPRPRPVDPETLCAEPHWSPTALAVASEPHTAE